MACSFFERDPQNSPNANVVPFSVAIRVPVYGFLKGISKAVRLPAFIEHWLSQQHVKMTCPPEMRISHRHEF